MNIVFNSRNKMSSINEDSVGKSGYMIEIAQHVEAVHTHRTGNAIYK